MTIGTPIQLGRGTNASPTNTLVVTDGNASPAGNLIVVFIGGGSVGATVSSVTDTAGNSYTIVDQYGWGQGQTALAYSENALALPAGGKITVVYSTNEEQIAVALSIGGIASSGSLDSHGNNTNQTGSSPSATTATLSQAAEIVLGYTWVTSGASDTITQPSGFTGNLPAGGVSALQSGWQIVSSTGPVTYNPVLGTARTNTTNVVSFKATSALTTTGSATGAASASGVGSVLPVSTGHATGIASASGQGVSIFKTTGAAFAAASASGQGGVILPATGSAAGLATAIGQTSTSGAGAALGVADAEGVGGAILASTGTATGLATAQGSSALSLDTVGSATGIASASGIGALALLSTGTALGQASASGVGAATQTSTGIATGLATAQGYTYYVPAHVPTITQSDMLADLRTFLLMVLPQGVEVFKGQGNRAPEPQGEDFVVMTPTGRLRLATNVTTWDTQSGFLNIEQPTQIEVQLDIHGPASTDNAQVISTYFRDAYACSVLGDMLAGLQPLYCDDGHQIPFINGEAQYEDRWVMTAVLQANPVVSTPQQFAQSLVVGVINVDATYPPGSPQ